MAKTRLLVLVSGNGSNLQAILDACRRGMLDAEVTAVFSNRADAYGLERARHAEVPARVFRCKKETDRREYDRLLADSAAVYRPDFIILAGWMRLLSGDFLSRFPGRVVNIHPALPGTYPGTHAIERAWEDWQAGKISKTGVMVHLVPDEGVDNGPLLAQQEVPILPTDTLESLEKRIHQVEHRLYVETLQTLIRESMAV
jgi:phosphoribosylglycinamide formyltransferase-1